MFTILDRTLSEKGSPQFLLPRTTSASPSMIGRTRAAISDGSCCPSASRVTMISPVAISNPRVKLLTIPIRVLLRITVAPTCSERSPVSSVLQSSTTITSSQYRLEVCTISPTVLLSLLAGITAEMRSASSDHLSRSCWHDCLCHSRNF